MKNIFKNIFKTVTASAVAVVSMAIVAPAADAADPTSNDPQVSLLGVQYSTASFDVSGSEAASASLKTSTGLKVVLNVHTAPMPKSQTNGCWKVKPGTVISNEVIDPATGRKSVIRWVVPANDNIFCHKKGAGKQVFKKSCGNRVWGVPGGPKRPPVRLPRIKGKVSVQDYLTWNGALNVQSSQSGSATAYAVQYYNGTKVCEASASVNGAVTVGLIAYVSVQARTRSSISVSAANSAKVSVSSKVNASGELKASVSTQMSGQAKAWCNYVPPTPPPPAHQNPTAEIFVGEHAVDLYGTMPVFGRVKAFDGATATLGSPVVTPSDLGMISNWRTVSTERDGVTPCETGYVCYQGTFRVTKDGTPGTYVYGTLQATADDTKGGTFTTQPLSFSVYYAVHPNT